MVAASIQERIHSREHYNKDLREALGNKDAEDAMKWRSLHEGITIPQNDYIHHFVPTQPAILS